VNLGYPVFIEAKDDVNGWQLELASRIITTNKPTPNFSQAGCPSCRPTDSVKALKGKYHIPWTCLPQVQLGVLVTILAAS